MRHVHTPIKLIKYLIIPLTKLESDQIVNELRTLGVIFYSKKNRTIYVADEIVILLRKVRGKEVSDKFLRRILRILNEPQLNLVCKRHNIDRHLAIEQKRQEIIKQFSGKGLGQIPFISLNLFISSIMFS